MSMFDKKPSKPQTFADALMGGLQVPASEGLAPEVETPQLTEKALVLESFTRFAEEKLSESAEGVMSFPGGELARKPDESAAPIERAHGARAEWESTQANRMGARVWQSLTANKDAHPKVLFIGESLREEQVLDKPIEAIRPEFLISFIPPVADLFQKMVQAMKLAPSEYVLMALKDAKGEKSTEELLEDISWWNPQFVVPLGALATQAILGSRERLATVHGKFFPIPRGAANGQVAPLFHPSVIASNANMKKSTWADMQKIMQQLGKI